MADAGQLTQSVILIDEALRTVHSAGVHVDQAKHAVLRTLELMQDAASTLRHEQIETARKLQTYHTEMVASAARVAALEQQVLSLTEHLERHPRGSGNGSY